MKTTLKRGIGRSADVNGNGRAVFPPAIEPVMRRYRQPEPEARRGVALFGKILLWVSLVAVMLAGGVVGGTYLYVERDIAQALGPNSLDVEVAEEKLDAVIPGEPTTALVVGYDRRAGVEQAETGHSDTLMLVRADPELKTVTMLSFPRDLLVDVQCDNRPSFVARINVAYSECGSTGSLLTVRRLTGLPINYLVTVNFRGFKQVVANLGGVWMDVDRRYFNDNSQGGERYATIDLQPGYQRLNGEKALDFVRYRHADSDIYRLARQQQFVKAVKQRLTDFNVLDLPKLVSVVTKNVEVGKGDGTDFDVGTILDYALFAYSLPGGHVFQVKIDPSCYGGDFELTVAESCMRQAVSDFAQPDVDAPAKATAVALRRKVTQSGGPPPAETSVMVLNGNGQQGSAATASSQLAARGYQMIYAPSGDANAPSWEYFNTEVYYDESAGAKAAATRLADLFGDARVGPLPAEITPLSNGAMLTVIVGQTYHGSIAPAAADRTPKRTPPQVSLDSSAVAPVREAIRRVPYTLYVPSVVATGSYLDRAMPINVYKLGDHNSVRLTFTNGIEYWGIQQTDWEDAPALGDPNEVTTIKGRTYRLYYSGANLHMVVLETPESTVWVVNTLLDKLSNETMIEIAKSLRPLPRR
jgi:LCP family protein required for cell wall assembly